MNEHGSARAKKRISRVVPALVASIAGATTILLVSDQFGLGTSNDGVLYLSAARHLIQGEGLTDFRGDPLVIFPPLFSTLIAVVGLISPSIDSAARILQALLYAGNVLLAAAILSRLVRSFAWFVAGLAVLVVSRTFLLYHFYVLSEPLFILLTLATVLFLCRWTEEDRPALFIWAAVFAGLSCLTRYPGIANVLLGLVVALSSSKSVRSRIVQATSFAFVSVVPLAIWLVHNAIRTHSLTGERLPSPYPFVLNLRLVADSLVLWFVPDELPEAIRLALVVLGAVGLAIVLRQMKGADIDMPARKDRTVVAAAAVIHIVVLVAAVSVLASDYITTRFVMPIYVPLLALTVSAAAWLFGRFRTARPLVVIAFLAWFGIQLLTTARLVADRFENGVGGFATAAWEDSQIMQFLRAHPDELGTDAYSNAALGVYFHTGLVVDYFPVFLNPRWADEYPRDALEGRPTIDDVRTLAVQPDRTVTLAWFNTQTRDPRFEATYVFNQYSLDQIGRLLALEPVFEAEDGAVYRINGRLQVVDP